MSTLLRKQDHLDLCLQENVDSARTDFWDSFSLPHCACPDLNLNDVSIQQTFLTREYPAPVLISSMTGGTPQGFELNRRLAQLSSRAQIPMGVGSQRVALENPARLDDFAKLKKESPGARLWANLGLVQLNHGVSESQIRQLCDSIEAEALILHLNPLQEALQPEGDTQFVGLWAKFENLRSQISIPIIVKETGCGLDERSAARFLNLGADALDIAGMGGTHWGYIEGRRRKNPDLGQWFRHWGIPTPLALQKIRQSQPRAALIASGGIKNGVDAAKAIFLGADMVGLAKPYLQKAAEGEEALERFHQDILTALRVSLFCCDARDLAAFQNLHKQDLHKEKTP